MEIFNGIVLPWILTVFQTLLASLIFRLKSNKWIELLHKQIYWTELLDGKTVFKKTFYFFLILICITGMIDQYVVGKYKILDYASEKLA